MANLSDDLKQALCPRPCEHVAHTEVEQVGGVEVLVKGTPPPPLCDSCPHRASEAPPIRHIKVARNAYSDVRPVT
jgi:TPP-dependent indolepyruvate ferredoxin oxidoreductase alpha subunit